MSDIDKQRITAVGVLLGMGFHFRSGAWIAPSQPLTDLSVEADRLHALLVERARDRWLPRRFTGGYGTQGHR
jgi:hypothetical protein